MLYRHTYTGLSAEEMCGSGWKSPVHTGDVERLESWWGDLVQFGEPGNTEVRFRRLDGEYRWVQISAVPVRDEKGNVVRWYGINIDKSSIGRSITDAISQSVVVLAPDGTTPLLVEKFYGSIRQKAPSERRKLIEDSCSSCTEYSCSSRRRLQGDGRSAARATARTAAGLPCCCPG
jgi:PAS domain S-box-containing protein